MASPGPADNTNQLQITDLAEVLRLLRRHGYSGVRFYDLGLFLGLSTATLDAIEKKNRDDVPACLRECLKAWLLEGGPTIHSLVSALRELEQKAVAHGIDMEMHPACKILARYTSNQSLVTVLPQLTASLCSEVMKEKAISINVPGEALLIQIKEAVCNDYQKLEAFAKILCKITPTADIGNAIMSEYREVYFSDDLIKPNDSNGEASCRKDFLTANSENAEELKIFFRQSMIKEFKTMRLRFGETFSSVKDIMKKNPQAFEMIRDTLNFSYRTLKPQLAQCQDINSVLELISENCSLNDISMLEFFVTRSKVDGLVQIIEEYNEAIKTFSETKLIEYLEGELSYASPLQCERITIVVDRKTDDCTLDDVRRLSADTFSDLSQHVRLNVIRDDNSFTITCSFPLILSEQLITAALNNIDVLKENKVKRLTIGYCTVYEVNDTSTPTKCGLMKQLMLSLSVQLINSTEEVTTLNEESMTMKKEMESLKKTLDTKNKMLTTSIAESERFKRIAAEAKQLLQEKVSHSTESEKENEKLKEIKELLEKQLALFQSEKEDGKQLVAVIKKLAETNKAKEANEDTKHEQNTDKNEKLEQLMLSQNEHLIKREQKLIYLIEEMQSLQAQVEQLSNDEAHGKLEHMEKQNEILLKENEKLRIEVSMLRKQNPRKHKQDTNPIAFQDDIYGEIVIDHPLIIRIVKTRQFQRLKDIKKLGYTYLNIPKASYSRFQHSVGMYYLAGKYIKQLRKRQPELNITHSEVLCVQIAALCYNLGHGPFSHIFQLFLNEVSPKPWERVSEASVLMFDFMIKENDEVKYLLEECLENYEEDIAFIKEVIHDAYGTRNGQHKGKEFLYEIVVNKTSGLDVCMIDYTTRDAAVLGMNINFKWRVFFSTVEVKECEHGERHIFFKGDDLETCNDLFRTRHSLHRELYYVRRNRIAAHMIIRILVKSNDTPIIRDGDRRVALSEATKSMSAYSQLSDSILSVIKLYVDDPEVQHLLSSLESMKLIGQIGYVVPEDDWNEDRIKQHIVNACTETCNIADYLIIDPIKSGYENHKNLKQYCYNSYGYTGQWTDQWANPPENIYLAPVRIFLVTGDINLIKEVQDILEKLLKNEQLVGDIYSEQENFDLMPPLPPLPVLPNV